MGRLSDKGIKMRSQGRSQGGRAFGAVATPLEVVLQKSTGSFTISSKNNLCYKILPSK